MRLLEAYAGSKNNYQQRGFSMDLSFSQVKATVKSVARWTWDRYTGSNQCNRGVMDLDKAMPLKERQRLAAEYTHQARQNASESKIKAACRQLLRKGEKLTQVAVASASGLSRQTVAKYQQILKELVEPSSSITPLRASSRENSGVNYAVYQIPAPEGAGGNSSGIGQLVLFPVVKPPD